MFKNIVDLFSYIYIPKINFFDIIEIIIISLCIYYIVASFKDTRMWIVGKGLLLLGVAYLTAQLFGFDAILTLFQGVAVILTTAIVVVFQPEIRKFLESMGSKKYILPHKNKKKYIKDKISDDHIEQIVSACKSLAKAKTGALIVLEKDIPLNEYIETGINLNANISSQLLINTFEKNTPLHDGAVIIKEDKVVAATCYLPLSENEKISKRLGTRHRAAIGMSEVTDAIIIVVSEETGNIAIAKGGQIKTRLSADSLKDELVAYQQETAIITKPTFKDFFVKNYKLKILSIILGILCWGVLMNTSNPIATKTFYDIPIKIENANLIEEIGQTYSIKTGQDVSVFVKCNRRDLERIKAEDILVVADFEKLSPVYSVELTASIPKVPSAEITINEDYMKVSLEDLVETEYNITVNKIGTPDEGCYVHSITPESETLSIKGPASIMKKIDTVCLDVDVSGITQGQDFELAPVVYDKNGDVIRTDRLSIHGQTIKGKINTLKTKSVQLTVVLKPTDILTESLIKSYTADVDSIMIAATDDQLASTDGLTIEIPTTINESQAAAENFSKNVKLKEYVRVDGIYVVDESISTNISIEYNDQIKRNIQVPSSTVKLTNTKSSYKYAPVDEFVNVVISGTRTNVAAVTVNNLSLSADVRNYYPGTKTVEIAFKGIEKISFEKSFVKLNITYR